MPLFRYNAGNIVGVSTLKAAIKELSLNAIKTEHAIVDAGYYSEKNIKALYEEKISFLARLIPSRKLYEELSGRYGMI
jgi:transposase